MLVAKKNQTLGFRGARYKLVKGDEIPELLNRELSDFQKNIYFENKAEEVIEKVDVPKAEVKAPIKKKVVRRKKTKTSK